MLRKVPEAAAEVVLAATHKGKLAAETTNLLLFCMLVLQRAGVQLADVMAELRARLPQQQGGKFDDDGQSGDN